MSELTLPPGTPTPTGGTRQNRSAGNADCRVIGPADPGYRIPDPRSANPILPPSGDADPERNVGQVPGPARRWIVGRPDLGAGRMFHPPLAVAGPSHTVPGVTPEDPAFEVTCQWPSVSPG